MFDNLSKTAHWYPEFNKFTDCVCRALSKQAAVVPVAMAANDKVGGLLAKLMALGTLGGIGAGGLGFLMSRNSRQTSADNAAMLEKVRAFRQLRRDIDEDMQANDVMEQSKAKPAPRRYDV